MAVNLHQNHSSKVIQQINVGIVVRVIEKRHKGLPLKVARWGMGSDDHLVHETNNYNSFKGVIGFLLRQALVSALSTSLALGEGTTEPPTLVRLALLQKASPLLWGRHTHRHSYCYTEQ
ncbi:hypothetical protein E2C01_024856 [Portunus trituberculatus]|uniref:Uncharacterized protein n=1 Tax=Portunus trituberculatus TaxID=210409 RepID=A0A5B7EEZ6_PORTR|nr:hypothetical protein [Portunus trituberculatus]